MFRTLDVDASGETRVTDGPDHVTPPPEGVVRWVDVSEHDAEQLEVLAERFGFHPLTIEDCAHFDQRPKLEEYDEYMFLVTHGFELDASGGLRVLELHTFIGNRFIVTVHAEPIGALNDLWSRLSKEGSSGHRGAGFLSYLVADAMVDTLFPLVDRVAQEVEDIQESLLERSGGPETLDAILHLKRLLVRMRKVVGPQRDVLGLLSKRTNGHVTERTALYFRNVHDHLLRITESLEGARELLAHSLDAYLWVASERTNQIVKRLTLLSAIFLPLTFLTGFFGQNFEGIPYVSNGLLVAVIVAIAALPAGMLYFFRRSKWF